jgi:hypothetical protein
MKLWTINGTPVGGFGSSGVLTIGALPSIRDASHTLPADRYIVEIRLVKADNTIALLREVVEIWAQTTTAIGFAPTAYLDSRAVAACSGANLAADSTIGGATIGMGSGSGQSEIDPKSYNLAIGNTIDVEQDFHLENDSLFATMLQAATTGGAPGEYGSTAITDFSVNKVLWVKVISEDLSTTRFYKFTFPDVSFENTYGDFTVMGFCGADPAGISWLSQRLIITGSGPYHIRGNTTTDRIEVQSGVTTDIILEDVAIDVSGEGGSAAFWIEVAATVNLTLRGTNSLKSGNVYPGIGVHGSLVIGADSTGSLVAMGGKDGGGIGGGSGYAKGGAVMITGGTVSAMGGSGGSGIGAGGFVSGDSGGAITAVLAAVVIASYIQPTLPSTANNSMVITRGADGVMYGSVTLQADVTIPQGYSLRIKQGQILTIPANRTLRNYGTIYVDSGGFI